MKAAAVSVRAMVRAAVGVGAVVVKVRAAVRAAEGAWGCGGEYEGNGECVGYGGGPNVKAVVAVVRMVCCQQP